MTIHCLWNLLNCNTVLFFLMMKLPWLHWEPKNHVDKQTGCCCNFHLLRYSLFFFFAVLPQAHMQNYCPLKLEFFSQSACQRLLNNTFNGASQFVNTEGRTNKSILCGKNLKFHSMLFLLKWHKERIECKDMFIFLEIFVDMHIKMQENPYKPHLFLTELLQFKEIIIILLFCI